MKRLSQLLLTLALVSTSCAAFAGTFQYDSSPDFSGSKSTRFTFSKVELVSDARGSKGGGLQIRADIGSEARCFLTKESIVKMGSSTIELSRFILENIDRVHVRCGTKEPANRAEDFLVEVSRP